MTLNLSTYQPTLNPSTFHTETRVVSGLWANKLSDS
jgi:hypothetical protein